MIPKIVRADTGEAIDVSRLEFPISIHGAPGTGSSLFSVALMANLLLAGRKVLLFSAFEAAKDEFGKFLEGTGLEGKTCRVDARTGMTETTHCGAMVVGEDDPTFLVDVMDGSPDIGERIVMVKNAEITLTSDLFDSLRRHGKYVVSGDLDASDYGEELLSARCRTRIFFSRPKRDIDVTVPETAKYVGWAEGQVEGEVKLSV